MAGKIVGRSLLVLLLIVYIVVALASYSIVQSYLGSAVGSYFSKEWGGKVSIGSLSASPWHHLVLHNVKLEAPDGDKILDVETLRVTFKKFPYSDMRLAVDRVYLARGYYHLAITQNEDRDRPQTNLQYIIDHYSHGERHKASGAVFTVDVNMLTLNHVHYKMDLIDHRKVFYDQGVEIPHMEFYDICGKIKDIHVVNDDVTCNLIKLSTEERSGFKATNIAGNVHVGQHDITVTEFVAETPKSRIMADVEITYDGWEGMMDYEHDVQHDILLKDGTTVALSDVAYWAPVLWGIDMQFGAEGHAWGCVDSLRTDGLDIDIGRASRLLVAGKVDGILEERGLSMDINEFDLRLEESDLQNVKRQMSEYITPTIAHYIDVLQYADLHASAAGSLQSSSTVGLDFICGLGNLRCDAIIHPTDKGGTFAVEMGSNGLGLDLLETDWLTHSGFALSATGNINDIKDLGSANVTFDGSLLGSVVKGRQLSPLTFEGHMANRLASVEARCADTAASFEVTAEADMKLHKYHADIDIDHLNTYAFGLMPEKFGKSQSHIRLDATVDSIESMEGLLKMDGTKIGDVAVEQLTLTVHSNRDDKKIVLNSDPLDATVSGNFAYSDLPIMVSHFCKNVLPDGFVKESATDADSTLSEATHVTFHADWNDDGRVMRAINDKIMISKGTRINGSYNRNDLLKLVLRSDSIRMGGVILDNIGVSGYTIANSYRLDAEAQEMNAGTMELLKRVRLTLNSNRERGLAGLTWGEEGHATRGDLLLSLRDGNIKVLRPTFFIGDDEWALAVDSCHVNTQDAFGITANGISIANAEQRIDANISLLGDTKDFLEMRLEQFGLGLLSDLLLEGSGISLSGSANGRFSMYGLTGTPYFNTALTVDSCHVNGQSLGDVEVHSNWNAEMNTLNLDLRSEQIAAEGWVGLGEKDPDLNLSATFEGFNLSLVAPLLSEFSSRFEGHIDGNLDIMGTASAPIIIGEANVTDGALKVDVTGVTYYFDDRITFGNNIITLDNFRLRDPLGNFAFVNGDIHYRNLQDVRLDLTVRTDNLLLLNQPRGEQFSGTLLASANGIVRGNLDKLNVDVSARTNPGCVLTVPVSDQKQVKAQNFITFVSDEPQYEEVQKNNKSKDTHLKLTLDLSITPDLQLNLPMTFSEIGVKVGAIGQGDLHLNLEGQDEPQVMGNYEITSGSMKVSLLSVASKNFTIESGSNLGFQGALPDARFDLRAVYSQRVNLSTLTGSLSSLDNTQKYLQVEDIISIAGTLQEPTISFDLRLPGADQSVEDEVFAYIDRNSERDMINQTISLLLLGQFYNVSGNETTTTATSAASGGLGTVASTLGGWMADIVDFVDIDVDYKAGNDITKDQLDVNISKDWGRWYIESTLGYGGESRELEADAHQGTAVIDALVGYRISPLVHLFAYNRTNTNDYTRMDLPYKQGIGLKLTKDFDRWTDLFSHKNNKPKRKKGK